MGRRFAASFVLIAGLASCQQEQQTVTPQDLVDLSPYACAPSGAELERYLAPSISTATGRLLEKRAATPFYIDESPGLSMRALERCVDSLLVSGSGLEYNNYDSVLLSSSVQDMVDFFALRQLREHPERVFDPSEARLHFTGLLPSTSWIAFRAAEDWANRSAACAAIVNRTHSESMESGALALERRMRETTVQKGPHTTTAVVERTYVIISTFWATPATARMSKVMALVPKNVKFFLVAIDDHWGTMGGFPSSSIIVVPHVSSYRIEMEARLDDPEACLQKKRKTSIFFAGSFHRHNAGARRGEVLTDLFGDAPSSEHRSFDLGWLKRTQKASRDLSQVRDGAESYANGILDSRFCATPEGDTPTSRRIWDSIGAGCTPVFHCRLNATKLSFRASVDWRKLALFAGDLECNAAHSPSTRALGRALDDLSTYRHPATGTHGTPQYHPPEDGDSDDEKRLVDLCLGLRRTFVRTLSWYTGGGAANMLLREVYATGGV